MAMRKVANAAGAEVLGDSDGGSSDGSAFWALAVETWRAEGASVSEFCRREGLNVSSFYRWRRKLTAGAKQDSAQGDPVTKNFSSVDGGLAALSQNDHGMKDSKENPTASRRQGEDSETIGMKSALPKVEQNDVPSESTFISVRLESSEGAPGTPAGGSGVEILIDSHRVLRVERGFDRATLQAVLSVLEAGAC